MTKNQKQIDAFNDETQYQILLCGRQSGKTTLIKHKINRFLKEMPNNTDLFYIAPTNQQAMDLMWDALDRLLSQYRWKFVSNKQAQTFSLSRGRKIYLIGAEKIRRIRGHRVYHAFLDEFGFYQALLTYIWEAVSPALSTINGGATLATTPPGKSTDAYDFYINNLGKPDWSYHTWSSLDNPAMSVEFIESARANMDAKSFRQEYLASWESYEGLAYYNFDEKIHIKKQEPIDPNLPLILHFDFNVNPTTLLLAQRYPHLYSFKKEYSFKNSSTEKTIKAFCDDFKFQNGSLNLKIRGDASGSSRASTTGYADYHYIFETLKSHGFNYQFEVKASNPPIVDRVRHVNSYLLNTLGQHRVEFDPSMSDTIRDLSSQEIDGRHPSDKNNLGHKADAVGYGIYWDWLINNQGKSSTTQL